MLRKLFSQHEMIILLIVIGLSVAIGLINPAFFTVGNAFQLARAATITGIFSMGVLIVLISGGIDVSFTGIAIFAMYTTVTILANNNYEGGMLLPFVMAAAMGLGLGLVNAFFIAVFRLPTLIVTLGTLSLFRGAMLFWVGSDYFNTIEMPPGMIAYARAQLFPYTMPNGGTTSLHPTIFILLVLAVLVWLVLRYTMLGRSIFAIGGDREAAERAGFNIMGTQVIIYAFVGLISGIGGMIVGALFRQANPFSIVGTELDVIAAAVLGGASLAGGRGSVIGTLLGVVLITIVNNSLVLMGVPSQWQRFVVGMLILLGTGLPLLRAKLAEWRRLRGGGAAEPAAAPVKAR